ncbi:sodium-dependent transporter [Oceanicoccus sp. KOV_DT_Chl]|uniref:sodium-dependent transporter n=1 Tax=Oceanicoccus sp. KOV_DT_Chl TaxID=1904639 RepID=UPI001F2A7AE7|nr:sodium-dependent transporter [Oceanicoccus sp. KOV_DT_Chl]
MAFGRLAGGDHPLYDCRVLYGDYGLVFGYLCEAVIGNLDLLADPDTFGTFINSNKVFVYFVVVAVMVNGILLGGVKGGIERAAKILMPTLFVMLIALVLFVLTLDNAFAGVTYYLVPDFSKINAGVINGALSQAFFSLSLGMGIMITYGSYMSRSESVANSAKFVALMDTGVAFAAGLLIIPAIFSFNPATNTADLSDSSVGLIFSFLPKIFLALQATIGYVGASAVAALFFLLVFFAALTSLVSITEVPTSTLVGEKGYSRPKALLVLSASMAMLTFACILSFGRVDGLTSLVSYAGVSKSLFDVIIDVFYDTVLPLNGLLVCLFVIYRWRQHNFNAELEVGDDGYKGSWIERYVNFALSTFIPVILLLVFINTVLLKYWGFSLIG